MCRLFGMHAGLSPVTATFWLLTAPDSLAEQSRRMADGFGIGVFQGKKPVVDKAPIAAYEDAAYASAARTLKAETFVAHVRYASTGGADLVNTHPFLQDNRLLAHNGVVQDLDVLDDRLRQLEVMDLVQGQTDSERVFALITGIARENGGDLGQAIAGALTWIAENLHLYAVNLVITTPEELYAVRYPDTHPLYVLQESADDQHAAKHSSRISVKSDELEQQNRPSVMIATERMDENPNWRLLDSGEVLRVGRNLAVERSFPLPDHPRHLLRLADLDPVAAASQHPKRAGKA
ncbi:class II glutamine amidotransferase [Arthrobacter sp. 7Tela_A1]|uniref:class II glutamine amidotransferase n=1 Tax=Arthrobacter sp. 7Tela_A1 TaxID=3093745 RepID=UPI003BB62F15